MKIRSIQHSAVRATKKLITARYLFLTLFIVIVSSRPVKTCQCYKSQTKYRARCPWTSGKLETGGWGKNLGLRMSGRAELDRTEAIRF